MSPSKYRMVKKIEKQVVKKAIKKWAKEGAMRHGGHIFVIMKYLEKELGLEDEE